MKKKLKTNKFHTKAAIVVVVLVAVVGALLIAFSKAATPDATLSLSPSSGSFPLNTNFTVSVYENSGSQEVNGVSIGLDYDESKLQFVSIDKSGSSFPVCTEGAASSGVVKITCITDFFSSPPVQSVTGNRLIAKVTFKATAAVSNSPITFVKDYPSAGPDAKSAIYLKQSQENIWNKSTVGGSYTVTSSTNTGGNNSGGAGGTGTSNSGSSGTKPSPSPVTTAPKTAVNNTSGAPSTTGSGTGSTGSAPSTSGSSGAGGNLTAGLVAVKVTDAKGAAVAGAQVWLNGTESRTDASGTASFSGIAAGTYTVTVKDQKGTATKKITVNAKTNGVVQQFSVQIAPQLPLVWIAGGAGALIVLVVMVMLLRNKFSGRRDWHYGESTSGVVVNGRPIDQGAVDNIQSLAPATEVKIEPNPVQSETRTEPEKQPTLAEIEESVGAKKSLQDDTKGVVASTISEPPKQ